MPIASLLTLSLVCLLPAASRHGAEGEPGARPQAIAARPAASQEALTTPKVRKGLHAVTNDLARLGRADLVSDLQRILRELGATDQEAKGWERKAQRFLERAKGQPKARAVDAAAKKLRRAIDALSGELKDASGDASTALAAAILRLDSAAEPAHLALGHAQWKGSFAPPETIEFERQSEAAEAAAAKAAALDIDVKVVRPSTSPLMRKLYGEHSHSVSSHGITLHGGIEAKRLERALRQGLRGVAFSHWVMTGEVLVPKLGSTYQISFVDNDPDYAAAADAAVASSWFTEEKRDRMVKHRLESFLLVDGQRCSRWRPEGRISSLVHWTVRDVVPAPIQPGLWAGHVNWVSLRFFGTAKPTALIQESRPGVPGSTAKAQARTDALWRAANSGVFGARCWIRAQLRDGKAVSFNRAVLDQEGKIAGEPLLIATLAAEYLHITGKFAPAAKWTPKAGEESTVVEAMESALGRKIPEFDDQWTAWLMAEESQVGLLQRLRSDAASAPAGTEISADARSATAYLAEVRERAYGPLRVFTEAIEAFAELCAQNALHAAYLNLHPEQKAAWPDAHEEYPDQEGFTATGAWAGTHSVIAFTGDATLAIDQWMGTFFHRLPLLDPGLCGVGLAIDEDVVVLDIASLANEYKGEALVAWPHDGMEAVPVRFVPEIPNPVPGEDQTGFGYPFTVQAYWGIEPAERTLTLAMFAGDGDDAVECHVITPDAPLFDRLSPEGAYCLIPKQHLAPSTDYRVEGRCPETGDATTWRFRTGGS